MVPLRTIVTLVRKRCAMMATALRMTSWDAGGLRCKIGLTRSPTGQGESLAYLPNTGKCRVASIMS